MISSFSLCKLCVACSVAAFFPFALTIMLIMLDR